MTGLKKFKVQKFRVLNNTLAIIAFFITALAIVTGSVVQSYENLSEGMISPKRYVATRDMEDVMATNALKEEAQNSVGPLYKHDDDVQNATFGDINELFDSLDTELRNAEAVGGEYSDIGKTLVLKIPVALTSRHYVSYGALSSSNKTEFRNQVIQIAEYVYDQGVTEESKESSLAIVNDRLASSEWGDTLKNAAYQILSVAIKPNLVLDEQAMNAAIEQKISEIEPVMIYNNQKIVDEGEVITQEILNRLEAYNLVNQDYAASIMHLVGSILIVLIMFGMVYIYFIGLDRSLMMQSNQMMIIFIAYIISILSIRITASFDDFYFVPLYIFAMLVSVLVNARTAIIFSIFTCVAGIFIFNGQVDFLIYFIITSCFGGLLMQFTEKRKHIIVVSGAVGIVNFVAYVATKLFFMGGGIADFATKGLYCSISGVLTVILVMGSMPVWEALFDINTPLKLMELANPNSELLRRLMIEAPGTYHHSLLVANLAEAAAYEIGANTSVVRVGAYYHDIGKLAYPLCFAENQGGHNVHDNMLPQNSARIIIQHVSLGEELARKYKLPKVVRDIIMQHHGTTATRFFYHKAVTMYSKENVNPNDYTYPGPSPTSKEAAVVMLADTIEAAVRASISGGKNISEVEGLIDTLIKGKLDAGQFNNCDLTFKDIAKIKTAFASVFKGMYHDRIEYPKDEEETTQSDSDE